MFTLTDATLKSINEQHNVLERVVVVVGLCLNTFCFREW